MTTCPAKPILSLEAVSHQFGDGWVLREVSLLVREGECVGLLGSSGAGKSTLFNLIAGLLPLQTGSIRIEAAEPGPGPRPLSYMLQKDLLLEHKTVLGNLMLPLKLKGQKSAQARAQALKALEEIGMSEVASYYPAELSGGMRQRIALLRTRLQDQRLLLLDEAFSALDVLTKQQMHDWYRDLQARYRLTTLLITHDPDEALKLCSRIYILGSHPGRIVAELQPGRPAEGEEAELWQLRWRRRLLAALEAN